MQTLIHTFLLVVKAGCPEATLLAKTLCEWLKAQGAIAQMLTADISKSELCSAISNQDVLIVLGGDGTLLGTLRKILESGQSLPPCLGFNFGRVGFLAEFSPANWKNSLQMLLAGKLQERPRLILKWSVPKKCSGLALNDVVVGRGSLARLIPLRIVILEKNASNQDTVSNKTVEHDLGWVRSDGILISTPQGTSAYALSAHGALMHPEVAGLALTPISPFMQNFPAMVLPPHCTIRLDTPKQDNEAFLTIDGQEGFALEAGESLVIQSTDAGFRLLTPPQDTWFDRLCGRDFIRTSKNF